MTKMTTEKEVSIESIVGYKLDSFQKKSLSIIVDGNDLLVTVPTSMGKTTVALTAIILNAFDKGHRAILTTPVKALSNQKYAEFQEWFRKIGYTNRITLLTGDIQARATPEGGDGGPELLIMTSEILANKLEDSLNPDLVNVSVLVMDEAHYINDTERGHVWERTIMYLPKTVQIVALSATLSEPEKFQEWLSRRRSTQLVQRHDRHVPLHFGFYSGSFVELYKTSQEHKVMDSSLYKKLMPQNGTFASSITKIVKILEKEEKLPAIIFSMSKTKCEEAANCLTQNLLYGSPPVMKKDEDPLAFGEIESEHQYAVKTIRNRQDQLFQKYLRPYHDVLEKLPGFELFKSLIDKGIAYHHAGMIPILREYVEILFSEKLIKVVFATETLAIGINMPAKTVVFTSLEKPGGKDDMILLRPEQFMQMSGRAGRRGMDEKGYVVYYPIRTMAEETDFRHLLFGKMPSVVSQLSIEPLFVLKNISREDILGKTLLYHQNERYVKALVEELEKLPTLSSDMSEKVEKYLEIKEKLNPGLIRVSNAQRKAYEKEIKDLNLDENTIHMATKRITIEKDISKSRKTLEENWDSCLEWLEEYGFMEKGEMTIPGKIASGLSDGLPLIRASMIGNKKLNEVSFEQFAGWLGCFTETLRVSSQNVPEVEEMHDLLYEIDQTCDEMRYECEINYNTGMLVYLWAKNKDIHEICSYLGAGQLGTFVKSILRVISYMDEMKKVLLGLQYYELYNKMEHHQDRLMDGIVSNRSLYVEVI
jgi:superfamily II RNA helicase